MESIKETAIQTLRRLMTANNMKQADLARLSGVDKDHVNAILNKRKPLTDETAAKFAAPFGLKGDDLFRGLAPASKLPPTIQDAISLLSAYQDSDQQTQGIAFALLSGDLKHVPESLPASVHQAVSALLESLKSSR